MTSSIRIILLDYILVSATKLIKREIIYKNGKICSICKLVFNIFFDRKNQILKVLDPFFIEVNPRKLFSHRPYWHHEAYV